MATRAIRIERAGQAWLQDLGRPGYSSIGVPASRAADQHAARSAQILVANPETAPLLEVTGSELALSCDEELMVAVTGSADDVLVDGHRQPAWQPVHLAAGALLTVTPGRHGLRTYVAVNGVVSAHTVLGSVAPDPLLGAACRSPDGWSYASGCGQPSAPPVSVTSWAPT